MRSSLILDRLSILFVFPRGGGVLPYKGLMWTCGQSGYVFRDFCHKQGIDFYHFVLNKVSFLGNFLKEGIVLG